MTERKFITLDVSCRIQGYYTEICNNTITVFNTRVDPSYNQNVRNLDGNYLRRGGVNLTITNKDISEAFPNGVDTSNAIITFARVTENYPNRIYFTVDQAITAPAAYDLAHWTFGTISGNYWIGKCSFNTIDTSAVLIDDNKGE